MDNVREILTATYIDELVLLHHSFCLIMFNICNVSRFKFLSTFFSSDGSTGNWLKMILIFCSCVKLQNETKRSELNDL